MTITVIIIFNNHTRLSAHRFLLFNFFFLKNYVLYTRAWLLEDPALAIEAHGYGPVATHTRLFVLYIPHRNRPFALLDFPFKGHFTFRSLFSPSRSKTALLLLLNFFQRLTEFCGSLCTSLLYLTVPLCLFLCGSPSTHSYIPTPLSSPFCLRPPSVEGALFFACLLARGLSCSSFPFSTQEYSIPSTSFKQLWLSEGVRVALILTEATLSLSSCSKTSFS